ncbi:MAG: DUF5652 family protein [Patescibacteria group bacterium]
MDTQALINNPLFYPLVVWTLVWKGIALWRAARRGDKNWFIALLIVNLAGILEILYIYIWSKRSKKEVAKEKLINN